jgi:hypothetical protein
MLIPEGYRLPQTAEGAAEHITAAKLSEADAEMQGDVMRVWFYDHYDPPDDLPYNGEEGGYQFIYGGPYEPEDELQAKFAGIVPDVVIEKLANELSSVSYQWSGLDPGPDPDLDDEYVQRLYGSVKESLGPFEEFTRSVADIRELRQLQVDPSRQQCFNRLLYANVITALEAYLSDFFQAAIGKHPELRRRFVETNPQFNQQRFSLSKVFEEHERIAATVGDFLVKVLWHNLKVVKRMYADTLEIKLSDELGGLIKSVLTRHDLVHRNGRKTGGGEHSITLDQVDELLKAAQTLVSDIERQWKQLDPDNVF